MLLNTKVLVHFDQFEILLHESLLIIACIEVSIFYKTPFVWSFVVVVVVVFGFYIQNQSNSVMINAGFVPGCAWFVTFYINNF